MRILKMEIPEVSEFDRSRVSVRLCRCLDTLYIVKCIYILDMFCAYIFIVLYVYMNVGS